MAAAHRSRLGCATGLEGTSEDAEIDLGAFRFTLVAPAAARGREGRAPRLQGSMGFGGGSAKVPSASSKFTAIKSVKILWHGRGRRPGR